MQSLFAKLAAFGVIVGGFAATGDLRRLADRGTRLLNATTVPTGTSATAPPAPPVAGPAPGHQPAMSAQPGLPRDAPLGRPVDPPRLPTSTLENVDLATLAPGRRLTVWAGNPPVPLAFDIVDPATGEVLEQSASLAGDGPQAVSRRVRLEGATSRPSRIDRGGILRLSPLGVAQGGHPAGPVETLGPVRAVQVR